MAEQAIAVLFSCDPDTNDCAWDVFREEDCGDTDPITFAEALMLSCQDDFPPTRLWVFTGNDRARKLRAESQVRRLLGPD